MGTPVRFITGTNLRKDVNNTILFSFFFFRTITMYEKKFF